MTQEFKRIQTPQGEMILRAYEEKDVPFEIAYYKDSPPERLEYTGLNPAALPSKEDMTERYRKAFQIAAAKSGPPEIIVAELNGEPIGAVYLDLSQADKVPQLHLLIFKEEDRHRGLGGLILAHGLLQFSQDFNIQKFLIEPKSTNAPMNNLMKKLGFRYIKDRHRKAGGWVLEMDMSQYEVIVDDLRQKLVQDKAVKNSPPNKPSI